jgi:hypothetical protein
VSGANSDACSRRARSSCATKLGWFDVDHGTDWEGLAYAELGTANGNDPDRPESGKVCTTGRDGDRCFVNSQDTDLVVPGGPLQDPRAGRAICSAFLFHASSPEFGNDSIRASNATRSSSTSR